MELLSTHAVTIEMLYYSHIEKSVYFRVVLDLYFDLDILSDRSECKTPCLALRANIRYNINLKQSKANLKRVTIVRGRLER